MTKIFLLVVLILFIGCKTSMFHVCKSTINRKDSAAYTITKSSCTKYFNPFTHNHDSVSYWDSNNTSMVVFAEHIEKIGGAKQGTLKYYLKNDVRPFIECKTQKHRLSGQCKVYDVYNRNRTAEVGDFRNNELNGYYYLYHADSILIYTRLYKRGKIIKQITSPD